MWKTVKLGELLDVQNGYAFNSKQFSLEGEMPLIRIRDLKAGVDTETRYTGEYDDKYIVKKGDLLIGMDGEFRCYEWKGVNALLNQRVCRLQNFKGDLYERYLLYVINNQLKKIEDVTGFTTVKHLSSTTIKKINLVLPPLAEQQRIVAKLDKAFAEIDKKTQTALEKIENAYSFERNILDAALSGIDTTKHSYTLQQLLDMGWIVSHLDGNHGSDYPRKTEFIDKGVPYISANCVIDGNVVMSKAKYLSADRAAQLRKGIAKNGDVLFAHNATVGPTAILQTSEEKVILGTSLTYFRCNDETISNEYLLAFMRSRQFIKQYNDVMRQATRNQVPITKQRTFTFLIPEIDVQHKVAKTFGTLSELTAEIMRATDASKKQLNALKAAILAQELQPPQSEAA